MWMATFSDMVILLLTFFVMLMAMANFEDRQRVDAVFKSIRHALGAQGYDPRQLHISKELMLTEIVRRQDSMQPVVAKLRQAMSRHISDDMIRIVQNEREVRVRLDDRVFFKSGSTELHPAAYAVVADVARVLRDEDVDVAVEGHTDASGSERDNWELSSERALVVLLAMREKGPIEGPRLESSARGSFHPASAFGEDASWNRRIELVLKADHTRAAGAISAISEMTEGDGDGL